MIDKSKSKNMPIVIFAYAMISKRIE